MSTLGRGERRHDEDPGLKGIGENVNGKGHREPRENKTHQGQSLPRNAKLNRKPQEVPGFGEQACRYTK